MDLRFSKIMVCRRIIRDVFLLNLFMTLKCRGDCDNDGTIFINECCSNYHLVNGKCEACPRGFFGRNCSVRCPPPTYGLFCGNSCNCSASKCNHIYGCWNHACPAGFFGRNCSVRCPPPTYGLFCGSSCNCSSSECNHVFGCWHYEPATQTRIDYTFRTTNHITGSSEISFNPSTTSPSAGLNTTFLTLIVGGVIILFLIVIIIIQVRGQRKRNQNQERQPSCRSHQYVATAETVYCDIDENYDEMQPNRLSGEVKKEDIPLVGVELSFNQPVIPKDLTLSCKSGDSSNETSIGTERSSTSTSSSNGYLKPVHA